MEVQAAPSVMMPSSSSATTAANILHTRLISVKTATSLMTIGPENDPHPSWTFFPASATYIPHPTYSTSPVSSPAAAPSSPPRHTSPQPAHATSNNPGNNTNNHRRNSTPTSTPSTHHRILDHCFHVSIETRLKQAEAQYLASTQEQAVEQQIKEQEAKHQTPMSALDQDDWRRRQRSLVDEAVVLGRKGSNVEAIVDGMCVSICLSILYSPPPISSPLLAS
ncbi:hypothetical protein BC939DRAFT_450913 [Gamsiella multidivaricata]|uniref:uncharacterized protein n=1 Tax=Gamsiella multidivaricata TaxID=101098 RepID=UPI00221F5A8B|nr:uncharacterized protein BC939DRAFT_450913 [Gamsiella multidivaricata]KAI7823820.1 hypothetical protein BC939DRAFT_450913 [Gamsiella multidivaricata]